MTNRHALSWMGLVVGGLFIMLGTSDAAPIAIDLVLPTLTGAPGAILTFNGALTNTSDSTLFLNAADINLAGGFSSSDLSTLPFFFNAPLFLDSGEVTAAIDLFTVQIPNGLPDGPYLGQFTIQGGADPSVLDPIADVRFTVEVAAPVPEPATLWLQLVGFDLAVLGLALRRGCRCTWRLCAQLLHQPRTRQLPIPLDRLG